MQIYLSAYIVVYERETERENLKIKGIDNFGRASPNISASCDILRITLLTMSPRYIPDIIFSKPCTKYHKFDLIPKHTATVMVTGKATKPYLIIWIRAISI